MNEDALGKFSEGFASWRNVLITVPQVDRQKIFANAAADVAGFVARGLDKIVAADADRHGNGLWARRH